MRFHAQNPNCIHVRETVHASSRIRDNGGEGARWRVYPAFESEIAIEVERENDEILAPRSRRMTTIAAAVYEIKITQNAKEKKKTYNKTKS